MEYQGGTYVNNPAEKIVLIILFLVQERREFYKTTCFRVEERGMLLFSRGRLSKCYDIISAVFYYSLVEFFVENYQIKKKPVT